MNAPAMPVQSPFLPDTNIQYAWDSTSLGYLKTCPRLYYYQMIEGWVPKDESVHLRFGSEYHTAIENYDKAIAQGMSFDDAVDVAVWQMLVNIRDWDPDPSTKAGHYKNPLTLLQLVVDYFDHYRKDAFSTFILENGMPAVELSFRFALDWGPVAETKLDVSTDLQGVTKGQPYILCGHLDRVVTYQDDLYILDHKTTTTTPGPYYFNQWAPNNQMTLYTFAGQVVLGTIIRGVIIEAAQIKLQEPNAFVRGFTYRTDDLIDEWLRDLEYHLNAAEAFAEAGHWPMNDTACDKYGGCRFRDVCNKNAGVRQRFLEADFVQLPLEERWNPLKPR